MAQELSQPLPAGWTQATSKTGKAYYVHSETKTTQWEPPPEPLSGQWEAALSLCSTNDCLATRDRSCRNQALLWLKQRVCIELGAQSERSIVADLGCGAGEAIAELAFAANQFYGWDSSQGALRLAKTRLPASAHLGSMNFCAAGEILPAGAPAGRCNLVTCIDAAQFAFVSAASARRWARRVHALMCPRTGSALLLIPSAADIVHKTANSCIEHIFRGREILRGCGAPWPSNSLDVPIYGARYTLQPALQPKGSPLQLGPEKPQWLVTLPTLKHACASAGLRVDAFCSATTFLRWCGMGEAVHDAIGQARRARTHASWEALKQACGDFNASSWEELQMWTIAVLTPETSSAGRWEFLRETLCV